MSPRSPSLKLLGLAVTVGLLALYLFCPPFIRWSGFQIDTAGLGNDCTCGRALATFDQIDNPWAPIPWPIHRVIKWRLLFPLIWHFASLPKGLLLAMPYVGCVLSLWLCAWIVFQRTSRWLFTGMVTLLFACLPWFFTSTGWLAYFDSWIALAMLVVAFVPSRIALAAALLLAPWVDERILLALPACLAIRAASLDRPRSAWLRDLATVCAACAPYLLVRLVAWLRGDPLAGQYLETHSTDITRVPLTTYLHGLWMGYRAAWLLIVAACWSAWRAKGVLFGLVFSAIMAISTIGGLFVAQDMTRTLMIICPAVILGALTLQAEVTRLARWSVPTVTIANLLLPAALVMWFFWIPVLYLPAELQNLRRPPLTWNPEVYLRKAEFSLAKNRPAEALQNLEVLLQLAPNNVDAYVMRGLIRLRSKDAAGAEEDLSRALAIKPDSPEALFLRGASKLERGNYQGAKADVQQALDVAPADWAQRGEAEKLLQMIREGTPAPAPQ